ncbi:MAG TPA: hypothetical protein VGH38_32625, partial [Bryobacteraceae bacterium]
MPPTKVSDLIRLLNERQYATAAPLMEQALRQAAAESPERLIEAARGIVAWKGIFARGSDAEESVPWFRQVFAILSELSGPDSPAAMAAAENLASILGSVGRVEEAIVLREKVLAHARGRFALDDSRFMSVRDGLAFLYREAGQLSRADELYAEPGLCEHLEPAAQLLREAGARLFSICRPWSDNCHLWACYDAVLDCERLIEQLALDPCVHIHDHRGTHDGSKRGLVCTIHND